MKNQLFILYFLFSTSCTQELPIPDHLPEIGAPALHSVQSKRLKTLMNELNDLMFERMLDEVQIDRQRRYQTEEIVNVAEKLLITVEFIPDAIQQLSLDKNEQKTFLNLTRKLKQQLTLLKLEAEKNHVDAIPKRVNRIVETCTACHHIFRQHIAK